MDTIKLFTGIIILVVCIGILLLVACFRICHIRRPAFIIDNLAEIVILAFVSMLMGLLLILS